MTPIDKILATSSALQMARDLRNLETMITAAGGADSRRINALDHIIRMLSAELATISEGM